MFLIHCYHKQHCNEYPLHIHNFAQVQVYPWDKFLEVILLILKSMCIWNFAKSCQSHPSQWLHQFTISPATMTVIVSLYLKQQWELENVWLYQPIRKRKVICLSNILLKVELISVFQKPVVFSFINCSHFWSICPVGLLFH